MAAAFRGEGADDSDIGVLECYYWSERLVVYYEAVFVP